MTTQLPLFPEVDPEPNCDDRYRELLQQSWNDSLRIVIAQYGIPPWSEQENLLNADELRLMTLIDESGEGWVEGGYVVANERRISPITVAAGFIAEANCVAVINSCIKKGYVKRVTSNTESRLMIDEQGRWRLDATYDQEETLQDMPRATEESQGSCKTP